MRVSREARREIRQRMNADMQAGMAVRDVAVKYGGYSEEYVREVARAGMVTPIRARSTNVLRREAALRELHSLCIPQRKCAVLMRMGTASISIMARRIGLKFSKAWGRSTDPRRLETMAALYKAGYTLERIGAQFGITRERVRQVLAKHKGMNRQSGGHYATSEARKLREAARKNARYIAKYGCTFEQWQSVRDYGRQTGAGRCRTPLGAFINQKNNAKHRGIGWELKFWQWWTIWQQSGHWDDRGRGQGYAMCRVGDAGPYAAGNVYIATSIQNSSEAQQNRKRNRDLPIGVRETKSGRYAASRCIGGVKLRLGTHDTPELAYAAYLMAGDQPRAAA